MKLDNKIVVDLLKEYFSLKEITDWINFKQQSTLRDEFAAKALCGICAHNDTWGISTHSGIAQEAYSLADAMLVERNKNVS